MSAYLLVTHGSRDIRPGLAVENLAIALKNRGGVCVGVAYLELAIKPLSEQILDFAELAESQGKTSVEILPLFLLAGVHVMEDIPTQVDAARIKVAATGNLVQIKIRKYLGADNAIIDLLTSICQQMYGWENRLAGNRSQKTILLAHGSRREGGNAPVEDLAGKFNGVTAYWSVEPSLQSRLEQLQQEGIKEVGIVPYFLFAGKITDAIAKSINELKLQFPLVKIYQAQPLGMDGKFADLIWNWLQQ